VPEPIAAEPIKVRKLLHVIGRFGWKDQHGSLLSFIGDAYLNDTDLTGCLETRSAAASPGGRGEGGSLRDRRRLQTAGPRQIDELAPPRILEGKRSRCGAFI